MTGHFVSFGQRHQHDLHVTGEEWCSALEGWGKCVESVRAESLGETGTALVKHFQQNKLH